MEVEIAGARTTVMSPMSEKRPSSLAVNPVPSAKRSLSPKYRDSDDEDPLPFEEDESQGLMQSFYRFGDAQSMWIELVRCPGDGVEEVCPPAAKILSVLSSGKMVSFIRLMIVIYVLHTYLYPSPMRIALVVCEIYLSWCFTVLCRTTSLLKFKEAETRLEEFVYNPSVSSYINYLFGNCCSMFKCEFAEDPPMLADSLIGLNAYEVSDALLKYLKINLDLMRNVKCGPKDTASLGTEVIDIVYDRYRAVVLQSQQPFYDMLWMVSGAAALGFIFVVGWWVFLGDPESGTTLSITSFGYLPLVMHWFISLVALILFWIQSCRALQGCGSIFVSKLEMNRLGNAQHLKDDNFVVSFPNIQEAMEEYLLIQTFYIESSLRWQLHFIIGLGFNLLLCALGIMYALFGDEGMRLQLGLTTLLVGACLVTKMFLVCTDVNEMANKIQQTFLRAKPGDFGLWDVESNAEEEDKDKDHRQNWLDFVESNPILFRVYGFVIDRQTIFGFVTTTVVTIFVLVGENLF